MKCKCGKSHMINTQNNDIDILNLKIDMLKKTINCMSCDFDYIPYIEDKELLFKKLEDSNCVKPVVEESNE